MEIARVCVRCGEELTAFSPERLCGYCLLKAGLGAEPEMLAMSAPEAQAADSIIGPTIAGSVSRGHWLDDYELLDEIARGGMGIVFRARQAKLNRLVALKVISAGPWAAPNFVQRFKTEAEAAAKLNHPNIVSIYEIGESAGHHYFTMELIEGRSLSGELSQFSSGIHPRKAAKRVATIARAVHYAHQRGILHRDLKPGNILLDAQGEPHITDFGLAKILEKDSRLTATEAILGTASYLAPEQAMGHARQVTTSADIYGLGTILYELLTGRPPFRQDTPWATLRQVMEKEPRRPDELNPAVDRDLAMICLKCLEKEPERRYGSAEALAEDLERWLRHEIIQARPASLLIKIRKWVRREPSVAALVAALHIILLLGAAGVFWQWGRASAGQLRARQNLYAADMRAAAAALEVGNFGQARQLLEAHRPGDGYSDLRGFEWRLLWQRSRGDESYTLARKMGWINAIAFSPDNNTLAAWSEKHTLQVWDLGGRSNRFTIPWAAAMGGFSFPGDSFAFGDDHGIIYLCEAKTGQILHSLHKAGELVSLLVDGKTVATTSEEFLIQLWDLPTGRKKLAVPGKGGFNRLGPEFGTAVALSPDGRYLASIEPHIPRIGLRDLLSRNGPARLSCEGLVSVMRFSADGGILAAGDLNGVIRLWDRASGWKCISAIQAHGAPILAAAFSPEGHWLATGSEDETIKLWEVRTGRLLDIFRGHEMGVWGLAFSREGKQLASGSQDQTIKIWQIPRKPKVEELRGTARKLAGLERRQLVWSPDGRLLAGGSEDGMVKVWEAASLKQNALFPDTTHALAYGPESQTLLLRHTDGSIQLHAIASGNSKTRPIPNLTVKDWVDLAVSRDLRKIAVGLRTGGVQLWDIPTARLSLLPVDLRPMSMLQFTPDGHMLIASDARNAIRLWDVAAGQNLTPIPAQDSPISSLAISLDGKILATGRTDRDITLWDLKSKTRLMSLKGHKGPVWGLVFAPDGKTLASGSGDGTVRLWNLTLQREVAAFKMEASDSRGFGAGIFLVDFSPDGNILAALSRHGTLKLFKAATFAEADRGINPMLP